MKSEEEKGDEVEEKEKNVRASTQTNNTTDHNETNKIR